MKKLIIEVAANETVTRSDNRHVPLAAGELAEDAIACGQAGASLYHFHPRDPSYPEDQLDIGHLGDVDSYVETMGAIRRRSDIIPYPTYPYQTHDGHAGVEGLFPHVQALRQHRDVRLETFVFFVGAVNMGWWHAERGLWVTDRVNCMTHEEATAFLQWCRESGLKPQFGVREPGHVRHVLAYRDLGLVDDPIVLHLNFSESVPFGPPPDASGIDAFVRAVPSGVGFEWFVHDFANSFNSAGTDPERHRILNLLAVGMEGHVRIGIGDLHALGRRPTHQRRDGRTFCRYRRKRRSRSGDSCGGPWNPRHGARRAVRLDTTGRGGVARAISRHRCRRRHQLPAASAAS